MVLSASSALSSRDSDSRSHRDRKASSSVIRVVVMRSRLKKGVVLVPWGRERGDGGRGGHAWQHGRERERAENRHEVREVDKIEEDGERGQHTHTHTKVRCRRHRAYTKVHTCWTKHLLLCSKRFLHRSI